MCAGLTGLAAARGQARAPDTVRVGIFGTVDLQNYLRAKDTIGRTFAPGAAVSFVAVRVGAEVVAAMADDRVDLCNIGPSPMLTGYANGLDASMVYVVYKSIADSECLIVRGGLGITHVAGLRGRTEAIPDQGHRSGRWYADFLPTTQCQQM